jgi:hypothetical protein
MRLPWPSALACLLLTACNSALAKGDGQAFGDDMGRFRVNAVLDSSTCGSGAVGAPERWTFDVVLSQSPPKLYWNSGANAVEGELDGRSFSFDSETVVNTTTVNANGANGSEVTPTDPNAGAPQPTAPACVIARQDAATGELDDASHATAFTGTLSYHFETQGNSDCGDAMLAAGFSTLPCDMSYRMNAAWVSAR